MLEGVNLPFWVTVALIVVDFAVKAIALGLVPERRRPTSGTAWLLLIFFLPGVGILLYLLLGRSFVSRRRRQVEAQAGLIVLQNNVYPSLPESATGQAWLGATTALNARLGRLDPVAGNRIELQPDHDGSIKAMAEAVDAAETFVHVEFAVVAWDEVTDPLFAALTAAVRRGVAVRLLFDHRASRRVPGYAELGPRLTETGIEWHRMPPPAGPRRRLGPRHHRTLLVVDGKVGLSGSPHLMFRVEGPLAHSLNVVFAADWYLEVGEQLPRAYVDPLPPAYADGVVGQVLASGPGFPRENNLRMFNSLVYGARHRLSITSPRFLPDDSLLQAITTAAQRGVAVELFVSEEAGRFVVDHAQQACYSALLEAGVRIHRHPGPTGLNAQHLSVDEAAVVIGSSNLDLRAFTLDFEVSVLILGSEIVGRMREIEDGYRAVSTELTLATWRRRPLAKRYLDNVMRLTSALH